MIFITPISWLGTLLGLVLFVALLCLFPIPVLLVIALIIYVWFEGKREIARQQVMSET